MRLRRVHRRRNVVLTARQEKLQAQRDIYEMRADVLCVGAAFRLSKSADNLTAFDYLRDFINTDVAQAVYNVSRAEKRYDESFKSSARVNRNPPRAGNSKSSAKHKPKTKKVQA